MLLKHWASRLSVLVACGLVVNATPGRCEIRADEIDFSPFQNVAYDAAQNVPESILTRNISAQAGQVQTGSVVPEVPADDTEAPVQTQPESTDATTGQPAPVAAPSAGASASPAAAYNNCAPSCSCTVCTKKKKAALKAAAGSAHKGVFYANDFSYLEDPCWDGCWTGDSFKRLGHSNFKVDFGGQYRARYHGEYGHRGLGITGADDEFLLHRLRLYSNVEMGNNIRFYLEGLHAESRYEDFAPRPIEENHLDVQNLFVDVKLIDTGSSSLVARAGRQEIFLGAQRYVSPLDWGNTRRTFDGGRLIYSSSNWNVDAFWLAPTVRDRSDFDESNEDSALYGVYGTKQTCDNATVDLYWLAFDNDLAGFYFDSLGARYNGTIGQFLFETEGAYQFGQNTDGSDHDAGFFVVGAGKKLEQLRFSPTTWFYFDWASGGDTLGTGQGHHHFQPLAHKYNGFMDLYGRRNLVDLNVLTTLNLNKKVQLLFWYHSFWLENQNDTPYSVTMAPQQAGVVPADDHLGHELDTVLQTSITPRSNILFGYSYFWAGDYYDTPGLTTRFGGPLTQDTADAHFFYTQYQLNF